VNQALAVRGLEAAEYAMMTERQATKRRRRPPKRCQNCEELARPLARVSRVSAVGGTIMLMVCRYCYLRLAGSNRRLGAS
jgi:hypothetical protein